MKLKEPSLRFIRAHIQSNQYRLTRHATLVRLNRGITMAELEGALLDGEIIERYPADTPYPSCLILGWVASGDPSHIVCSRGDIGPALRIVTLYEPDDDRWESDYRTRKVRR